MTQPISLKAIGYWCNNEKPFRQCPHPQWLVQPSWLAAELPRIVAYLRSGYEFCQWSGWSTCRFENCAEGQINGCGDFTDGEWAWPEGLAHYVERHAVALPQDLIETMRANNWCVPEVTEEIKERMQSNGFCYDLQFWIAWAETYRPPNWYALWRQRIRNAWARRESAKKSQ